MPDGPTHDQAGWNVSGGTIINVAGNLNQGSAATGAVPPPIAIPYPRNQVFLGRDDELRQIGEWLERPGAAVAIAGLGGVGKTQLAAEFAHACAEDRAAWPGGVFWAPMSEPAGIGTAVAAGGRALGIAGYDGLSLPEQIEATRRAWAGPERRLLVFDNCEDPALLKEWRPKAGGARVLLTARQTAWPPASLKKLPLGELPRAAARDLLCGDRAETLGIALDKLAADPAADAICEQLGDLALAIHMAAAYLAQRPYVPLAAFLADLQAQPLDHAALQTLDHDSPTEHLHHIAQTIELSYRLLRDDEGWTAEDGDSARDNSSGSQKSGVRSQKPEVRSQNSLAPLLLDLAAHCVPAAPIPLELLRRTTDNDEDRPIENPKSQILMKIAQSKIQNLKSKMLMRPSNAWSRSTWRATPTRARRCTSTG